MLLLVLSVGYSDKDGCCYIWTYPCEPFQPSRNSSRGLLQGMVRQALFWQQYQLRLLLLFYWHELLNNDVVNKTGKVSWLLFSWTTSLLKHLGGHNKRSSRGAEASGLWERMN